MKRQLILFLIFSFLIANQSCTTSASSAGVADRVEQEITITKNVNAKEFDKLIKEKETAIVLDVRTKGELAQGYINGAINIDINSPAFKSNIDKLDKTKPILVYCRSGRRSAMAMNYMRSWGFNEVYNLTGGIIAWNQANLPIIRK